MSMMKKKSTHTPALTSDSLLGSAVFSPKQAKGGNEWGVL